MEFLDDWDGFFVRLFTFDGRQGEMIVIVRRIVKMFWFGVWNDQNDWNGQNGWNDQNDWNGQNGWNDMDMFGHVIHLKRLNER